MTLLQNLTAMSQNGVTQLNAIGGTGPYVYSVVSGGGSINSSGKFIAPNTQGNVVLKATDSLGAFATVTIKVLSPIKLLCDIVQTYLDLDDNQVFIYNQKFQIPPDLRLYVAVSELAIKTIGNNLKYDSTSGFDSVNDSIFNAQISINIFSKSTLALEQKELVIQSLMSVYSQQQQQANGFSLSRISQAVPLNFLEGSAIPYRYNVTLQMQYSIKKKLAVSYYDDFIDPTVLVNS
jgi:hypothetical protein